MTTSDRSSAFATRYWILLLLVVGIGSYAVGARSAGKPPGTDGASGTSTVQTVRVRGIGSRPPDGALQTVDFEQFWELWDLLKTKFYTQPLDEQKMLYGAMSGLTSSLDDPYTTFFEPAVAEEFSKSLEGKFEGIGAEIGIKQEQLQIIAPLPESPAARAGLLPGDAILFINGTSTEGMTVEEAVFHIRGKKGTTVTLTIGRVKVTKDDKGKEKRDASKFDVSIVRDTIVVKSVRTKIADGNISVIEISHFNSDTTEEFAKAADEALAKGAKGVILDVRNNPGGFLDRATAVAGEWVGDAIVVTERRKGVKVDEFHGTGKSRLRGIPTVVLVNEGSASASEIVAGALQDYGVAKLIGKKTFGKGSVQDYTELRDGTAVKVTVAEWLTPNGRFINEIGIDPDIVIERTEEDYHAGRDPQLDKAIELLGGTASTSSAPTEKE
ncbi:S41 family peptidase [Candidatus Uhrbacteria bacterium]|nr:S41 family peptidase [Candidatus Uhrbacteria bacterium]